MRRVLLAAILCLAWCLPTSAQVTSSGPITTTPAPGAIQSTNAIQTCGPATGTITNVGDSVSLPCLGATSYIVVFTVNGTNAALSGTVVSTDTMTGAGRLFFKSGVNELDTNTVTMTGSTTGIIEYRTNGAGFGQKITLTAAVSGSATVTILGTYGPTTVLPNAPFHTSDEAAVRGGRAYSASTSYQSLTANQNLSLYISNPSTNNLRLIIPNRILSCDSATALSYFGLGNDTVNIPTTAVTPANRKTGGAVSATTVAYGVATTRPDTNPTTASPSGGIVPALGAEPSLPLRTLEPGTTYSMWISAPAGLGTTAHCVITFAWYEEPIN